MVINVCSWISQSILVFDCRCVRMNIEFCRIYVFILESFTCLSINLSKLFLCVDEFFWVPVWSKTFRIKSPCWQNKLETGLTHKQTLLSPATRGPHHRKPPKCASVCNLRQHMSNMHNQGKAHGALNTCRRACWSFWI